MKEKSDYSKFLTGGDITFFEDFNDLANSDTKFSEGDIVFFFSNNKYYERIQKIWLERNLEFEKIWNNESKRTN
jgi:hypothetical protein